jgi:hypothetical protein
MFTVDIVSVQCEQRRDEGTKRGGINGTSTGTGRGRKGTNRETEERDKPEDTGKRGKGLKRETKD